MTRTKLSFRVNENVAKALKHKAVDDNTTVQALLEQAVEEIIGKDDEK